MRVISNSTAKPPSTKKAPSPQKKKAKKKPDRSTESERVFNIRGGKLVLTFCSKRGLVNVQIVRGGEYGLTNAELGRVGEEELYELGQTLMTLSAAMKANKSVDAVVGG
jgi:hypothetical protein